MSEEALEVVSRLFELRARGDVAGALALLDTRIEASALSEGGRRFSGHGEVGALLRETAREPRRVETPLIKLEDLGGGRVLATGRVRIWTRDDGLADSPGVWVFEVRGGKVRRIESYRSRAEALGHVSA